MAEQDGVPVSRNVMRIRGGKEPTGTVWAPDSVSKVLRSWAILGAIEVTEILERDDETGKVTKRSRRKPLYGDDGQLVLRAEPLVDYSDWAALQARLSVNDGKDQGRSPRTPLLKVAYCGLCGSRLYVTATKTNRYYTCSKSSFRPVPKGEVCRARRFPADLLENEAARVVLEYAGAWEMMTPKIRAAEEYSAVLAQVTDAIANLWEMAESGVFKGRAGMFKERFDQLEQRRGELAARPSRSAETTWTPSGRTVA